MAAPRRAGKTSGLARHPRVTPRSIARTVAPPDMPIPTTYRTLPDPTALGGPQRPCIPRGRPMQPSAP